MAISRNEFDNFLQEYGSGVWPNQRIGQAFLNKFYDDPDVAEARFGSYLWEEDSSIRFMRKVRELKLVTDNKIQHPDETYLTLTFEEDAIVMLQGAMGTGKSTFCENEFNPHDCISSDAIRQQLSGDFEDQSVSRPAFEILHATLEARAKHGLFTVVDSTGSNSLLEFAVRVAKDYHRPLYLLKFPELTEQDLNANRMQHRMKYLDAYHRQVERIRKYKVPKAYKVIEIPREAIITDGGVIIETKFKCSTRDVIELDPDRRYIVVGDLHGEYTVLEHVVKQVEMDPLLDIVLMGDIVDRGESPYRTFSMVKDLMADGRLFVVESNHDNKFYRYCKKWLNSEDPTKYDLPLTFGMTLSHGLEHTVAEMIMLPRKKMERYAKDFIAYYESLPTYLTLKRDTATHFFAHGIVTANMVEGRPLNKADRSDAIYQTMYHASEMTMVVEDSLWPGTVVFHIGHNYGHNDICNTEPNISNEGRFYLYQHDVGFGKREVSELPPFVIV